MTTAITKLYNQQPLTPKEYYALLESRDSSLCEELRARAEERTEEVFGKQIYLRALIEISNICPNDCLYCGIRRSNKGVDRYQLTAEEILSCCQTGYDLGFRTFVLQGGESHAIDWQEALVKRIRSEFSSCAITLSLGEMSHESYQRLYSSGTNRYLLRHEACNKQLYSQLHPATMSHRHRIACLNSLKEIGYQVGCGFMVGAPYQRTEHLVEEIDFITRINPQMVGIGPFLPHSATPFAHHPAGSLTLTLRLISILRLLLPHALIPSTTALATLHPTGRLQGIKAGANVVMPNLSPTHLRKAYALYNNKAALGAESGEGLALLQQELDSIGYTLSYDRGDYKA